MKSLNECIQNCRRCRLCLLPTNILDVSLGYGKLIGNGGNEIMVVGQNPSIYRYPGHIEALGNLNDPVETKGLFREMLHEAGIDTSKIYWTNLVKCSMEHNIEPPENITNSCCYWLLKEIEEIKPKKIVSLGSFARKFFLSKNIPHSSLYHYSFISRFPNKRESYLQSLREVLV